MNHLFKLNKHSIPTFCTWVTYIDFLKNIEPFSVVSRILSLSWEDSLKAREEKEVVGSLEKFLPDCCECLGLGNRLSLERTGELQECFLEWSRDTPRWTESLRGSTLRGSHGLLQGSLPVPRDIANVMQRLQGKLELRGFLFYFIRGSKLQYWLTSDSFQIFLPFYSILWNYSKE